MALKVKVENDTGLKIINQELEDLGLEIILPDDEKSDENNVENSNDEEE